MTGSRMTEEQIHEVIVRVLRDVAPEIDLTGVAPDADLREELGLDSMDILNLAIGLQEQTGIDVPERDYPQIVTVAGCTSYLLAHAPA